MREKKKILYVENTINEKTTDKTTAIIKTDRDEQVFIDNHKNIKRLINSKNWQVPADGYPVTRIKTTDIRMHQLIMEYCFGNQYVPTKETRKVIDHLNNNHCDNRLRNLHILPIKDNNDKKLLDLNFDNLTVYIEYNYNFDHILNQKQAYTLEQIKEIYDNRKYILSYISTDILFVKDSNGKVQHFNCFELVYDDYCKFIKDVKQISKKTKEMNRISNLFKKNPHNKEFEKLKKIQDIKLNKERLEKQKQAIENILNKHEWLEIRNTYCNMLKQEEFSNLPENEQKFYKTLNATVYQWLPPNTPKLKK